MSLWKSLSNLLSLISPCLIAFFAGLALTLVLVPLCRRLSTALGMVDKPSARRINKVPIPRGGGLAIVISYTAVVLASIFFGGGMAYSGIAASKLYILLASGVALALVGFVDDKFSLPPKVKLLGQLVVAFCCWKFADVGFSGVFHLPAWLDCALTMFWITGAINAYNLIDGLDGLASGLSFVSSVGMMLVLLFIGHLEMTPVYLVFAGACLGFLRYNFHPASVFLGDTGSMFLGFFLSTTPLITNSSDSFLVSVLIPLLAMGVPIFDTSLAIIRRTLRAILRKEEHRDEGNDKLMQPDTDHLHHRLLRKYGSQRNAVMVLYLMALFLVAVGFGAVLLKDKSSALFIIAIIVMVVVVLRDMQRIELWDAGRILRNLAYRQDLKSFRRRRILRVPMYIFADMTILCSVWVFCCLIVDPGADLSQVVRHLPIFVTPVFLSMVAFSVYRITWGRAIESNYMNIVIAVLLGVLIGDAACLAFDVKIPRLLAGSALMTSFSIIGLIFIRALRGIIRTLFFHLDLVRTADEQTERVLFFGAGIRYRSARLEFVRMSGMDHPYPVGIIDDDILLKDHYVGDLKVLGTMADAERIVKENRVTMLIISCAMTPERRAAAVGAFRKMGVKVKLWNCEFIDL